MVPPAAPEVRHELSQDRKSTRLNSSHLVISYAVFCLKKKNKPSCSHSDSEFALRPKPISKVILQFKPIAFSMSLLSLGPWRVDAVMVSDTCMPSRCIL